MLKPKILALVCCTALLTGAPAYASEAAELARMQQFISLMQGYFEVIHATHAVASDPEKSAILQLQKIQEIYEERGDKAEAITVLRDVVDSTPNPTIRNAAAMMLADALNETGRASQAVEVLQSVLSTNLK